MSLTESSRWQRPVSLNASTRSGIHQYSTAEADAVLPDSSVPARQKCIHLVLTAAHATKCEHATPRKMIALSNCESRPRLLTGDAVPCGFAYGDHTRVIRVFFERDGVEPFSHVSRPPYEGKSHLLPNGLLDDRRRRKHRPRPAEPEH